MKMGLTINPKDVYFKKTRCGMVLMVKDGWDDDGMEFSNWIKAKEEHAAQYMQAIFELKEEVPK